MVQYDLNKVYIEETKQDLIFKIWPFKDGQDHKDKYIDTSRKISSQEMTICIVEALKLIFLKL